MSTTIGLFNQLEANESLKNNKKSANKACSSLIIAEEESNKEIITNNFKCALLNAIDMKENNFQFSGLGDTRFLGTLQQEKNQLSQIIIKNSEGTKGNFSKFEIYLSSWNNVTKANFPNVNLNYLTPSYSFWNGSGNPPPAYEPINFLKTLK